ncbi:MAG: class I SAM-dependent methyltransferase [Alphaproteobacteria bacterium]
MLRPEPLPVTGSTGPSRPFRYIETLQGDRPWGAVLDAGTGTSSLRWIASLPTERWTAVTGAEAHAVQVRDAVAAVRRPQDRIVLANWTDPALLQGERYDTVIADYLLGAVEGFAPYFQTELFARLRPLVGGRLYIVGLDPYVGAAPETAGGRLIWRIGRFRDACLQLAGEMTYREYPAEWVTRQLERAGYVLTAARRFGIRYRARFVDDQIDMCLPRLGRLRDRVLAAALRAEGEALRRAALEYIAANDGIRHGHNYVIAAEPTG